MFVPRIIFGGLPSKEEVIHMGEHKLTWRDVMDCKKREAYAFIGDMACTAVFNGYRYFVWDDKVYHCMDNVGEVYEDTGISLESLG